jgi:hypothetical protein
LAPLISPALLSLRLNEVRAALSQGALRCMIWWIAIFPPEIFN